MISADTTIRLNVSAAIVKDNQILVIEFTDENGIHYNLPGGGVEVGESLHMALARECLEEANADVTVGRLLLIWEYVPRIHGSIYGARQKVGHVFECKVSEGYKPFLPATGDKNQTNVKWIPLSEITTALQKYPLFPTIGNELVEALESFVSEVKIISRV